MGEQTWEERMRATWLSLRERLVPDTGKPDPSRSERLKFMVCKWTKLQPSEWHALDTLGEIFWMQEADQVRSEARSQLLNKLNECESAIVQALRENGDLNGADLAAKAGYPYNSNFKSTAANLRKRGIISNEPGRGYFLPKSGLSQD